MHSISPVLKCDDARAAIEIFERGFGFERNQAERRLRLGGDATPGHAQGV